MNNEHPLQQIITTEHDKVRALVEANNARLAIDPTQPVGDAIMNDSAIGTLFLAMCEFITSVPTAVVDNVEILDVDNRLVKLQIPLPNLFDGYITRRAELLMQGIHSMAGQSIDTVVPTEGEG